MSDLLQKAAARQALARHACLVEPPASPPTCDTADFAHATDAANFLLATDDFPPELRSFVDSLIGLAGSRTGWFSATDELIAERMSRSTRTVSRHREEFFAWQAAKGVTWLEVQDHFTDSAGQRHAHQYRVHLHKLAVETTVEARGSAQWFANPGIAIKQAAINKHTAAPNMQARKRRGRKREPDAVTLVRKKLRTASTLLREAAKLIGAIKLNNLMKGGGSSFQLDAELVESVRQGLDALSSNEEVKSLDRNTGGREKSPPVFLDQTPSGQPPCRQVVHKESPKQITDLRGDGQDGRRALDACASVGACLFRVFFKDDGARIVREVETVDDISARIHLDQYLARSIRERRSLILDLKLNGRRFIQVDEASPEVLKLLSPVSFMQIQTSDEGAQSWLALAENITSCECEEVIERLFARLKQLGANRGSAGGLRWPQSLNYKPSRRRPDGSFPVVRLLAVQPGRVVTPEELTRLGLLADLPKPRQKRETATRPARRVLPSYEVELRRKPSRSEADMAFLAICRERGFTRADAVAALEQIPDSKAYERREKGVKSYINGTAAKVFGEAA